MTERLRGCRGCVRGPPTRNLRSPFPVRQIPRIQPGGVQEPASIDWRMLDLEFASLLDSVNASADAPIEATLDAILAGEDEESVARIDAARAYARRLSADTASAPTGHVFVNGKHFELDDVCCTAEDPPIMRADVCSLGHSTKHAGRGNPNVPIPAGTGACASSAQRKYG